MLTVMANTYNWDIIKWFLYISQEKKLYTTREKEILPYIRYMYILCIKTLNDPSASSISLRVPIPRSHHPLLILNPKSQSSYNSVVWEGAALAWAIFLLLSLYDVLTMISAIPFVSLNPRWLLSCMTISKWLQHNRHISYGWIGNDVFILINDAETQVREKSMREERTKMPEEKENGER